MENFIQIHCVDEFVLIFEEWKAEMCLSMGENSSYILGDMKDSEMKARENSKNYKKRKNKIKGEERA